MAKEQEDIGDYAGAFESLQLGAGDQAPTNAVQRGHRPADHRQDM